jgi:hypothetical protein
MKVRSQEIRPAELGHALGLTDLRWRRENRRSATVPRMRLDATTSGPMVAGVGLGTAIDGVYEVPGGIVLCGYNHGRYTARQVMNKLSGFRSATRLGGPVRAWQHLRTPRPNAGQRGCAASAQRDVANCTTSTGCRRSAPHDQAR